MKLKSAKSNLANKAENKKQTVEIKYYQKKKAKVPIRNVKRQRRERIDASSSVSGVRRCILRPDRNNEVQIPINNLTLTDIKIDREETITRAEKCEDNLQEDGAIMEVLDVEVRENCVDRTRKILASYIGTELDISQRKELEALVTRYPTCFALDVKELGCYSEMAN
ncbi:hypothetical protein QE152_g6878 [Popillia japonica]|uniref:Uncharacterized protein n=1 Tax=Popillia japonica TaxID=7064 RepID=A0AAW1MGZ9_POPJA